MSEDYYVQKVEEMLKMASTARDASAKKDFERLAEEYRTLAKSARDRSKPKRA